MSVLLSRLKFRRRVTSPAGAAYHDYHRQRYLRLREAEAKRMGAIINFLRKNPLSTNDEIFAATGYSCGTGCKYVTHVKYNGHRVYRLNHKRLREDGLE